MASKRAGHTTGREDTTMTNTTTTTSTDAGPRMEEVDPATLLIDRNVRRDPAPDKTLVESVRDLGVLVPLVAVRTDEGVRVRYGHRRTRAAIEAGCATVPVWVFDPDPAGTDVDRIVAQWAENEHRENLTDADRLAAVEQLSAFGVSAAQITKRLKTKRGQVDATLTVAKSSLAKAATERYAFLTLDQAATLAEFEADEDAETLTALVAAAKESPGQFAHVAQRARDEREAQAREQAARETIAASRVTVLDGRAPSRYGPTQNGPERLVTELTDADGQPLTLAGHATCPSHAAYLVVEHGYWTAEQAATVRLAATEDNSDTGDYDDPEDYAGVEDYDDLDPDVEGQDPDDGDGPTTAWGPRYAAAYVCRDYAAHGHTPRWTGYDSGSRDTAPASEAEAAEQKEAARAERKRVIENNKAWASAEVVRREWLTAFLTRKTAPKGSAAFVAQSLAHCGHALTQALTYPHRLGRVLLGCEDAAAAYVRGSALILALLDGASDRRAEVVTLGMVLAAHEDATGKHSWRNVDPATARYLRYLAEHGYTLTEVERLACGETPLPEVDDDPTGDPVPAQ